VPLLLSSGVLNLFVTGWTIKKFSVKTALLISVFWPAVRLAVQNLGVAKGGAVGITIIQASQIITVLGGPAGYLLSLNSYVAEVIEPSERTGALGKLQGCTFIGTALAYLAGGLISDAFEIQAPFIVTLFLFLMSCVYALLFLPWIPPNQDKPAQENGLNKFFGPLKVLTPQKWVLRSGKVQTEYGTILLGIGVFLGVLATGYIYVLLQMFATDIYGFGPTENGYLISLNSLVRGLFLTLAFPRIIAFGRARTKVPVRTEESVLDDGNTSSDESTLVAPEIPTHPSDFAEVRVMDNEEEPVEPRPLHPHKKNEKGETFSFDLLYSRYSLLADGILTGGATFVTKGWQLYLVSVLIPLAAGTGSAAKGSILQMCPSEQRTDALSAITLVEMVARLTTGEF
jgi:hypothetical protein